MRHPATWLSLFGAIVTLTLAGTQITSARTVVIPAHQTYQISPNAQCKSTGGVSVSPCPVTLNASDPAQLVTVTIPASPPGTVSEKDKCTQGSNTIATITPAGTNTYLVSSGNTTGKCRAVFIDKSGKTKIGKAVLNIVNNFAAP
jgi:hypothetical protein